MLQVKKRCSRIQIPSLFSPIFIIMGDPSITLPGLSMHRINWPKGVMYWVESCGGRKSQGMPLIRRRWMNSKHTLIDLDVSSIAFLAVCVLALAPGPRAGLQRLPIRKTFLESWQNTSKNFSNVICTTRFNETERKASHPMNVTELLGGWIHPH